MSVTEHEVRQDGVEHQPGPAPSIVRIEPPAASDTLPHTGPMNRRVARRIAVVATLFVLVPSACVSIVLWTSDGDRFIPTLDALVVPSSWEVMQTEVIDGGFLIQERATRKYFVDAGPVDGYPVAIQIAEAAGFFVRPRVLSLNGCQDSFPPDAMDGPCGPVVADDCPSYNGGLPDHCAIEALRWDDDGERVPRLWIYLGQRGTGFTIGEGDDRRYVTDPERALFTITVDTARRDAYVPLPSWPPP